MAGLAAYIFSAVLIVLGIAWYRSNPVSAGYPGSFLVMMGGLFGFLTWLWS